MPSSITPDPSAPLTPEREQGIRERLAAANPLPWALVPRDDKDMGDYFDLHGGPTSVDPADWWLDEIVTHAPGDHGVPLSRANAEFLYHAREDVPALLTEVERLRAELAARPTRAAVLREAKAEVVAWLAKKAREDTPVSRLADKVDRGAVRIFLEADTAEAAEQWAERDRRVAKLNARVEAHNEGEHAFCGDECDVVWNQGGTK